MGDKSNLKNTDESSPAPAHFPEPGGLHDGFIGYGNLSGISPRVNNIDSIDSSWVHGVRAAEPGLLP
jgi:hypothetical protein